MTRYAAAAIIALMAFGWTARASAKDGHGLNLDSPGLIDAVASVLYPYQGQETFTRVDDSTVLVEMPGNFILQLQRMPGRDCSFQSRKLNDSNPVVQQYNFSQLTGEYRTSTPRYNLTPSLLLEGEAAWCMKDNAGLRCWNAIETPVSGINETRKVLRATAFIQQNFCQPAKPKRPF
ncbi:hypothetical protein ABID82_005024 [Methylobacterium sp. PvP062]|uniref:CNP1-like uncharacterized domain-containing protein n=1 Tax=Methylobacterium radiotolerans TaxID=31998 RepID=A0ABV2NP33_9HYPH|nr:MULTISPECIES: hypothetical protein [unclassified Methylobacterium]MBP2494991.1 hypothetical protein [Methylobacterium sp. PvP105]MBP2505138.1 hypothetical protein [Methylobacterium sp. PvP109]MCX7336507.1 hypothetical protein [Hyphomicrobiales bacterium]